MSKHQAMRTILRELDSLNREIDLKIIRGLSYIRESKRHKFLMSQLKRLNGGSNWLLRSLARISAALF